jgi:hypothetical protein
MPDHRGRTAGKPLESTRASGVGCEAKHWEAEAVDGTRASGFIEKDCA